MYREFILGLSLFISAVYMQSIEQTIQEYFKSETMRQFRKEWDYHRKPLENAISLAIKETVGFGGMNVYIRKTSEVLAKGYYHSDNQVRLILRDLYLHDLPRCWTPDVQFSLASNVLKIQTSLSKMIINAEYSLVRNNSDILYETKDQDPYNTSPFLFQQVRDSGKVAIAMEGCLLSGYIMATLTGESVNMGYQHFRIINCQYTIEIYRPGAGLPPVIAKYAPYRDGPGLSITHLLLKPINDELVPKLQAAMFSFVNTTSIFNEDLPEIMEKQEEVFDATSKYLTDLIRDVNKLTVDLNNGALELPDYTLLWNDRKDQPTDNKTEEAGEKLKITDMVVTGLDTLYSAHIGGPYKLTSMIIGEEIRFSSVQVRGNLHFETSWVDVYSFAAEISDISVDLQLDIKPGQAQWKDKQVVRSSAVMAVRNIEVTGFRTTTLTVPAVIFGAAEAMLTGYVGNVVPRLIHAHLMAKLPKALALVSAPKKETTEPEDNPTVDEADDDYQVNVEDGSYENENDLSPLLGIQKQHKGRFKSAKGLLRFKKMKQQNIKRNVVNSKPMK